MPALLLIGALLLGGGIYLRHRRRERLMREVPRRDAQRWEDDGGALPASGELPRL